MKKFLSKTKSLFWGDEPLKGGSIWFIAITVISTIALLTSNILAGKSFSLFGWQVGGAQLVLTLGLLCFPISYITSDLISEVYGYSASRRVSWIGFASNLFMDIMIIFGIIIPAANPYYGMVSDGLKMGFGFDFLDGGQSLGSLGILIASLLAFVIGSWVDDLVFENLKKRAVLKKDDSTKSFVMRAVGSSLMGELCDSLIFIPLLYLFTAQMGTTITNVGQLLVIVLVQAFIKTLYELIVSPLTAKIAKKLKAYESNHKNEGNIIRED